MGKRQTNIRNHYAEYLSDIPQDCQGDKEQGKAETLPQTREDWGGLATKSQSSPGIGSET